MSRPLRIAFCGEGSRDSKVMSIFIRKILAELTLIEPFDLSINTQRWDTRRSFPEALVMARLYSNENFPLPVVSERRCAPKPASLSLAGGAC